MSCRENEKAETFPLIRSREENGFDSFFSNTNFIYFAEAQVSSPASIYSPRQTTLSPYSTMYYV